MRNALAVAAVLAVAALFGCGGSGSSAPPAIAVAISPSTTQTLDQGQSKSFTATVSNDSASKGVTWGVAGSGCSGTACGALSNPSATGVTYTAPASVSATLSVTLTATSVSDTSKTASVGITLNPPPAVTTTSLPSGTVGVAYSATLQASGGVTPLTWSIASGSLPAGLSLNTSTGAISGNPTTAGTSNFTAKVTDSGSPLTAQASLSITIAPPPLSITTSTLVSGAVNESYTATVSATGGTTPYSWSATGLPAGLSISATTGAITGTPTASGAFTANVTVTDSTAPTAMTTSKQLSLTIHAALAITTASLPGATVNTAYSQTLAASGGTTPYTWSISAGSLPAGLSVNSSTGAITGTPTGIGTATFTAMVTDAGGGSATAALSIVVAPAPLAITTTTLPDGAVTASYGGSLAASGGTPPVTWAVTVGSLPAGLSLNGGTGAITGTPTTAGTANFTVTATDATTPTAQTASRALSITINPVLSITTTTLANGSQGTAYTATVAATGGTQPYTWSISAGALPNGLNLNSSTGQISGTPTVAGAYAFTVEAADSSNPQQTATQALNITINGATLAISSTTLPDGTINVAYSTQVDTTGGTQPFTWSVVSGALPAGLTLNASTGVISGTPTATGTSSFTVKIVDSSVPSQSAQQALTLRINTAGVNNGELNGQYAFRMGGFSTSGYNTVAGSFTADGSGNISNGMLDSNDGTTASSSTFTGTYSIGADNRGTVNIVSGSGNTTLAIAVGTLSSGVATAGQMIDFDSTDWESGEFRKQDSSAFSSAGINGPFAFEYTGVDSSGGRYAIAGRFTNSTGNVSSGLFDDDDNGTLTSSGTATGTYSVASNGRGTMTLTVSGRATAIHQVLYVVSATEFFVVSADAGSGNSNYEGVALKQSKSSFSNADFNGKSVFYFESLQAGPCSSVTLGLITGNGTGGLSGSDDQNKCGTLTSSTLSATYSVAASGRMTVTAGTHPPVFYLVSPGEAFEVGTNPGVESGFVEPQTGGPFSLASITGNYYFGTEPTVDSSSVEVGTVSIAGTGAISGTSDRNQTGTTSSSTISDTFTVSSNGRVTGSGGEILYIASPSKMLLMDSGSSNSKVIVIQK